MFGRLLLDTDVLVEYLRGRDQAVAYLEGLTENLYLSTVTVTELFAGVSGDVEEAALRQLIGAFIVVPVSGDMAVIGIDYERKFGPSHGTGLADALIAATAEEVGADLVTFNQRHFPMVERLTIPYER